MKAWMKSMTDSFDALSEGFKGVRGAPGVWGAG
jgi:hypothetical protein